LYRVDTNCEIIPDYSYFSDKDNEFILIEEEPDIDIQSIKELRKSIGSWTYEEKIISNKVNEILEAIKQLDRQINNN